MAVLNLSHVVNAMRTINQFNKYYKGSFIISRKKHEKSYHLEHVSGAYCIWIINTIEKARREVSSFIEEGFKIQCWYYSMESEDKHDGKVFSAIEREVLENGYMIPWRM